MSLYLKENYKVMILSKAYLQGRVSKCCGHGGRQSRKFLGHMRKTLLVNAQIWNKIRKGCTFFLFAQSFELRV